MPDPFSAVAGALSVVDVALRTCIVLYDSASYLRDAPEISQQLEKSCQSIQSILQVSKDLLTRYRQSSAFATHQDPVPNAVVQGINSLKTDLDRLKSLLPGSRSLKWILQRKKLVEAVNKLESDQVTLILALQIFQQKASIHLNDDIVKIEPNIERHFDTIANRLNGNVDSFQSGLNSRFDTINQRADTLVTKQQEVQASVADLQRLLDGGQSTIIEHLSTITSAVSQLRLRDGHLHSETVFKATDGDLLARMFRAELHRVITPAFKDVFDRYKADSEGRLNGLKRSIDAIAQQLGRDLRNTDSQDTECIVQDLDENFDDPTSESNLKLQWPTDSMASKSSMSKSPVFRGTSNSKIKIKSYTRIFEWAIGTLWMTYASFRTLRNDQREDSFDEAPSAQKSYKVTITFQPSQSLINMRGATVSITSSPDQRGFPQFCPNLSTFAVIPSDSDVFVAAEANDVAGLQRLFAQGLAAPSDRDEYGWTPLMWAANSGASDTCRLLLCAGFDPLAVNIQGFSAFDLLNCKYAGPDRADDMNTIETVRLMHSIHEDVIDEALNSKKFFGSWVAAGINWMTMPGSMEKECSLILRYSEFLAQLGFRINKEQHLRALRDIFIDDGDDTPDFSKEGYQLSLDIMFSLGIDIRARSRDGRQIVMELISGWGFDPPEKSRAEMTILLQNGADPCALNDVGASAFDYAKMCGCTAEWYGALKSAGYDYDEVRQYTEWLQWCHCHPDHAFGETTGVDEDLIIPSYEGLSRRRVRSRDDSDD